MESNIVVNSNDNDEIELTGDIDKITNSRRALRILKDNSECRIGNGLIVITGSNDIAKTLNIINVIAKLLNCRLEYGEKISDSVNEYAREEENFSVFSNKAKDIRNNNCLTSEFKEFKDVLIEKMPNRTLYDLQMLSAYHMAFSQNACNFSTPGAGKTSVVYGAFAYLNSLPDDNAKHVDRILVIGPLSSFGPWEQEYNECFGRPVVSKRLSGLIGIDDKRRYLYSFCPAELTLISYSSVPPLVEELTHFLVSNKVMVVLDEAHKIKNTNGGITAESVLKLAEKCKSRIVLTGTPAPNGYEDLTNLFKFIWPTKKIIKFQTGQLRDMSKNSSDVRVNTLLNSIEPFFIRVKKSDLGIPPAINHDPIIVSMHPSQRKIYDAIEEKVVHDITDNKEKTFKSQLVKARVIRLMQAATNPQLLKQPLSAFLAEEGLSKEEIEDDSNFINEILKYGTDELPAKYEAARNLIERIISDKGKVVVWATFIKTIESFSEHLNKYGIENKILYGATPVAADGMSPEDEEYELTREAIIKDFNSEYSTFSVIIANPFAVAESISLHKACHNAIYLERSFNCAHFIQSKDRIHRYGLSKDVITNYYYLVSERSIDETVHERLIEKENRLLEIIESMPIPLFDNVLEDGGNEDIKAVLRDYARRIKEM